MKFYYSKTEIGYDFKVEDVFGTIVISSDKMEVGPVLDTYVSAILTAGAIKGELGQGVTFKWDKKSDWLPEDAPLPTIQGGVSPCSRTTTFWLALLLGGFGAHRFYIGRWKTALFMLLLTVSVIGIVASSILVIADIFIVASGGMHDANDRRISKW